MGRGLVRVSDQSQRQAYLRMLVISDPTLYSMWRADGEANLRAWVIRNQPTIEEYVRTQLKEEPK